MYQPLNFLRIVHFPKPNTAEVVSHPLACINVIRFFSSGVKAIDDSFILHDFLACGELNTISCILSFQWRINMTAMSVSSAFNSTVVVLASYKKKILFIKIQHEPTCKATITITVSASARLTVTSYIPDPPIR